MADWSIPGLTDTYATFLSAMKARDVDAAKMEEAPTNPPTGYIRWNRSAQKFQEWSGSAWVDMVLSGAGGGTGGTSSLGSMAAQNANAVAITGGTVSGISLTLGNHLKFTADATYDVGENSKKVRTAYIGTGLVIPVGVDKWVT